MGDGEPDRPFAVVDGAAALPSTLEGSVLAIGNFDGVHRGHAAVIARAKVMAARLGRPCLVLTFEPHPADYFARAAVVFRLTPAAARARAFAATGLDGVVVLPFDAALAALDAEAFVRAILVERLRVAGVVVGWDFHFGRARGGTPAFLREAGGRHGFSVEIVERVAMDASGSLDAVSSTAVRAALSLGDVATAARLLGHPYRVVAPVEHGQKLGRTLGYPTANMRLDASNRLAHGIYAVRFTVAGRTHDGVASFGLRPTVTDTAEPLLETFLFDFDGDLYGQVAEVDFVAWIRPEVKFDGLPALVEQMARDEADARDALA